MNSLQMFDLIPLLGICILLRPSEGVVESGDYIVDCSACYYLPLKGVDSYQCNVRCEAHGKVQSIKLQKVLLRSGAQDEC